MNCFFPDKMPVKSSNSDPPCFRRGMATVRQKLMTQVSEVGQTTAKITVVGVGQVGMAATFSMMVQVGEMNNCFSGLYYFQMTHLKQIKHVD